MSETAQHTPGPWHITWLDGAVRAGDTPVALILDNPDDNIEGRDEEPSIANACLIAAAPDLLSVAKRWAAIDEGSWNTARYERERAELIDDTRAAIAKAKGAQP